MIQQLRLPLELPPGARDVEFLVGESNAHAVQQMEHWGTWPVMAALLVGPRKSGRSLLAHIFAAKTGGSVIDNAERADETAIFHAWNQAQAGHRPLLIVADAPPPQWEVGLPDLRSRLAASPVLRLGPPDDALIPLLLQREFDRREMLVGADVVEWLAKRIERSHVALIRVADVLESEALGSQKRRVSIQAARSSLRAAGLVADSAPETRSEAP